MRFYVPEWDDAVDAGYDFEHDELSTLYRQERELDYIWDVFDRQSTPIDGVLISREQVGDTDRKRNRLTDHGVYDDPVLSVPEWLPTISDCGAWGYKSLPFPPYGNADMLEFYGTLKVSVGVTIDHLVLGSGKDEGRLYLDGRAFDSEFDAADVPDTITDSVELMTDEWPDEWPAYVDDYQPSIRTGDTAPPDPFRPADFDGDLDTVLSRLRDDPRAVYRRDDAQFRYDLTLRNAGEMFDLYQAGDYPFRLMVAIQGWDTESYVDATQEVLDMGYDYLGIGGVAGSPVHEVRKIVKEVGKTIKSVERDRETRVDSHVFGFAKTDAFDTIGRSGTASFDSASMLRSAWTGGDNYRLGPDERYDAIRIRYPSNSDSLAESIEKALRGRETLIALRSYADRTSIETALSQWYDSVDRILSATREYLRRHRHDDRYDVDRLRDGEEALRDDFEYAGRLKASFGDPLRSKLVKLLRTDDPKDPLEFDQYDDLLATADRQFRSLSRALDRIDGGPDDEHELVRRIVERYAEWIGDADLIEAYRETLRDRPWEQCDCAVCERHGVEVCIFRGNDRNRRRGFHNTRRFYDQFQDALPKIMIAVKGSARLGGYETIEEYLRAEHGEFWRCVHDIPVAEIGVVHAGGVREWWQPTPDRISFAPSRTAESVRDLAERYRHFFLFDADDRSKTHVRDAVTAVDCTFLATDTPEVLRQAVLEACGRRYTAGEDFLPHPPAIDTADGLNVLVIDQCSGSKDIPDNAPVLEEEEAVEQTREQAIARDNVPGIAATDLYTGRQQRFVTEGVRRLRTPGEDHSVERYFISAGFGLVSETDRLPPYETTFTSMNVGEIEARSDRLDIRQDLREVLHETEYDIVFFVLGSDYYTSIDIDDVVQEIPPDRIAVVFNRELADEQFDNVVSVPARTEDAKRHGSIVVGLKGHYLRNFADRLHEVDIVTPETVEELCRRVDEDPTQVAFEEY